MAEKVKIIISAVDKASKNLKDISRNGVSAFKMLGGAATLAAAGIGIGSVALFKVGKSSLEASSKIETFRTRLQSMNKSVEIGNRKLEALSDFATAAPFSSPDVIEAGVTLEAFGLVAEDNISILADLAAFMGTGIKEAASAMGRAFAGGAGAADIFRERGILQVIKDFKGIDDITKLTLPEFRKTMVDAFTDPAGKISGGIKKIRVTFKGSMDTMEGVIFNVKSAIGDQLLPIMKDLVNKTLIPLAERTQKWVEQNKFLIKQLSEGIIGGIKKIIELGTAFAKASFEALTFFKIIDSRTEIEAARDRAEKLRIKLQGLTLEADKYSKSGGWQAYRKSIGEVTLMLTAAQAKVESLTAAINQQPSAITPTGATPTGATPTCATPTPSKDALDEWDSFYEDLTFKNANAFEKLAITYSENLAKFGEVKGAQLTLEKEFLDGVDSLNLLKDEKDQERRDALEEINLEFQERKIQLITDDISRELALIDFRYAQEVKKLEKNSKDKNKIKDKMKVLDEERNKKIAIAEKKHQKESMKSWIAYVRGKLKTAKAYMDAVVDLLNNLVILTNRNNKTMFAAAKAAAIAQAVINTLLGATRAFAEHKFPLSLIIAAAVVTAGMVQVQKIRAQKMAKGGIVTEPTLILAGEAGPEKIIPLDRDEEERENSRDPTTINFTGPILGDEEQAREFAIMVDEELYNLKTQGQSLAFA